MAGKKYGLGEKYKALGVGKATLSINPMQDDLKKLKGMGAAIGVSSKFAQRALIGGGKTKIASAIKTSAKDKIYKGVLKTHNALKDAVTSKAGIGATGSAVGYELGKQYGTESQKKKLSKDLGFKAKKKMYGGAMKKMKIGGAAIKGKGAVVGGSGLQDEKLKPGKKYKVKKASLGVLMDAGMRNKKVMGAGALGLLSMLAKKKK